MHITPKNNVWFFFFEIYIKFPTFWYPKLLKRANRKQSKYYQKKKTSNQRFPSERARPSGKKKFFSFIS